jgi:uncharacterized protein
MIYIIIGFIFLFILTFSAIVVAISPYIILQPFRKTTEYFKKFKIPTNPAHFGFKYIDLKIKSFDGRCLTGWFIPAKSPKGTLIEFHGISDSRISGLAFMEYFVDAGYNVLSYDSRAQGESEGTFCTYGFYEKFDVKYAIDHLETLKEYHIGKIGVIGVSLGAAIALQSLSVENRISCCVAEASFAELKQIIYDYQKRGIFYLTVFLRKFILRRVEKVGDFKVDEVSPLKAVQKAKAPVLFLHGSNDSRISIDYMEHLYANTVSIKEKIIIPGADHHDIREAGGVDYQKNILLFLDKYLAESK